jgi:anti-sigma-K factor RskA
MTPHEQYAEDLALLAIGALDGKDRELVESHLETCAGCRFELQQLRRDAGLLALSSPVQRPSDAARKQFLHAIAAEPRVLRKAPKVRWWSWGALATTAALLVSTGLLWRNNMRLDQALKSTEDELRRTQAELRSKEQLVSLLTAPDAVQMLLTTTPAAKQPQARVVYHKDTGRLLLLANNLNPLPQDKTYELWLLPEDGSAPVPAGLFRPNAGGYSTLVNENLKAGVAPKAFAVTVEPAAGSSAPTMPIVLVTQS